jgi:hypothetical protein
MTTNLHTVIAIRIAKQLFEPCAVEELFNENFSCVMFGNSNTLTAIKYKYGARIRSNRHTFSITLELNF